MANSENSIQIYLDRGRQNKAYPKTKADLVIVGTQNLTDKLSTIYTKTEVDNLLKNFKPNDGNENVGSIHKFTIKTTDWTTSTNLAYKYTINHNLDAEDLLIGGYDRNGKFMLLDYLQVDKNRLTVESGTNIETKIVIGIGFGGSGGGGNVDLSPIYLAIAKLENGKADKVHSHVDYENMLTALSLTTGAIVQTVQDVREDLDKLIQDGVGDINLELSEITNARTDMSGINRGSLSARLSADYTVLNNRTTANTRNVTAIINELDEARKDLLGSSHNTLDERLHSDLEVVGQNIDLLTRYVNNQDVELRKGIFELEKLPLELKTIQAQIDRYRNAGFKPYRVPTTTTLRLTYSRVSPLSYAMDVDLSNFEILQESGLQVLPTDIKSIAVYTWGYNVKDKNKMYSQEVARNCYDQLINGKVNANARMDVGVGVYIFVNFKKAITVKEIQLKMKDTFESHANYSISTVHCDDDWALDKYAPEDVVNVSREHGYAIPSFDNTLGYDIQSHSIGTPFSLKFYPYKFDIFEELQVARLGTQSVSTIVKSHDAYIENANIQLDNIGVLADDLTSAMSGMKIAIDDNTEQIEAGAELAVKLQTNVDTLRQDVDKLQSGNSQIDLSEVINARTSHVDGTDKGSLDARLDYDFDHLDRTKLETSGGTIEGSLVVENDLKVDGIIKGDNTINLEGLGHATVKQAVYGSGDNLTFGNGQVDLNFQAHPRQEAPRFTKGTTSLDILHTGIAFKQRVLTQDEYDGIATKDPNTLYFIKEDATP